MSLLDLISSRLSNVVRQPDGSVVAGCPQCAVEGRDSSRNHLRVWPNGAFSCAARQGEGDHNKAIRSLIRGSGDASESALISETEYLDNDPKLTEPRVYSEASLSELLPDYSYWTGRGVKESVLRALGGGVASIERRSKLSGRYVLPARDEGGRIVGLVGRLLSDASFGPKYKNLGPKSRWLFPPATMVEPAVRATGDLILAEGPSDVLFLLSAGLSQVYSLFGVTLSSKLLSRVIALAPARVIIATNNEVGGLGKGHGVGNRAAESIRDRLSSFVREDRVIIALPPAKDFGCMTGEGIREWYASVGKGEGETALEGTTPASQPPGAPEAPGAAPEGGLEL